MEYFFCAKIKKKNLILFQIYIIRWWKNSGLVEKLPFVRDMVVESYFWAVGVFEAHQCGYERKMVAKATTLITALDDVYDIYGTLDEFELFTEAIRRSVQYYHIVDTLYVQCNQFSCYHYEENFYLNYFHNSNINKLD